MKIRAFVAAFIGLVFSTSLYAQSASVAVFSIPDVATLKANNLASKLSITLDGYNSAGDNGGGAFKPVPSCVEDGGIYIKDGANNCWQRVKPSEDLREFGITSGSAYDVTTNPTSALDSAPVITQAFTSLAAFGIHTVDTKQVSIALKTVATIPSNGELTCSIETIGPFDSGVPTGHPGTLVVSHAAYVQISNQSASLHNCFMIPEFLVNPSVASAFSGFSFTAPAVTRDDLEAIRGNMIVASDVAIYLNGISGNSNKGTNIHDVGIYGFDVCVYGTNPSFSKVNNLRGACNIGEYYKGGGGQSDSSNTDLEPFLSRQIASGGTGANIKNEVYATISAIAASTTTNSFGRHICRLTLIAGNVAFDPTLFSHTSALNAQGDAVTYPAWINGLSNITGGVGCQGTGPFGITAISQTGSQAIVDLVGSEYSHGADVVAATGQWTAGSNLIRIASGNLSSFQIGETIADNGSSGIPSGATITAIFPYAYGPIPNAGYIGEIQISAPTTISQTTDTAITLDGGAYTYPSTPCDGGGSTPCLYLNSAESEFAGTSAAANAIANFSYSKGHHFSAGYVADGNPGFRAINIFAFAYHSTMVMNNANNCNIYDVKSDNNGELDDLGRTGLVALGGGSNCVIVGHGQGKSATSFLMDLFDTSDIHVKNSAVTTWSIGTGLGTITTASSMAGWNNYAIGQHITVGGCQTYSMGCTSAEEYMSGVILGTNSLKILSRGVFNTSPISFANGMTVVQTAVTADSGSVGLTNIGLSGVTKFNNVLDIERGTIQATALRVNSGLDFAFFGSGVSNASIVGSTMVGVTPVYETQSIFPNLVGCGNVWITPQSWECYAAISPGTVSINTTLDASAHSWKCDASSGMVTLTVPIGATFPNWDYTITKVDSTLNTCRIVMSSSDTIGLAASTALAIQNDKLSFKNDSGGTNWILQ